jgi:tetratricopeptide (TPR) repeat protein
MSTQFENFGAALRFLRKRARLTQDELARAVGYSREQIGHLEAGRRLPDATVVAALFSPALGIENAPAQTAQLVELAYRARSEAPPRRVTHTREVTRTVTVTEGEDADSGGAETAREHRQAAQWAEMAEGDVIKAAREYALAGDIREAADVLTDQGAVLFGQGRAFETADAIDAVLARIDALPEGRAAHKDSVCRLLTTRADVLLNTARADEAERDFRAAMDLATGAVHANLVSRLCACLAQRGRALDAVDMARGALRDLPPHLALIRAQLRAVEGSALASLSRFDESEHAAREAVRVAEALTVGMPLAAAGIRARANNTLGALHAMRHDLPAAISFWRATIETARLAGMRQLEYRAQGNIATATFELGDLAASAEACASALDGLRALKDLSGASRFVHLKSCVAFQRGELDTAVALAEEACALKTTLGDTASLALSRAQLGKSLLALGRLGEAAHTLDQALSEAGAAGNARFQAYTRYAMAEHAIASGDAARAVAMCRELLVTDIVQQDAKLRADIRRTLALAHVALGETDAARREFVTDPDANLETALDDRIMGCLLAPVPAALDALRVIHADATARGYGLFARRALALAAALDAGKSRETVARGLMRAA